MKQEKNISGKILMGLILVFFYLPIVFMIVFSFNSSKSLTAFSGFSLRWYQAMFANRDMMESLYVTVAIAVLATVISTFAGTITAIGTIYSRKLVRRFIQQVNDLPMMNPEIVTAIGLMLLFITFSINRGFITLLLAHIAFCIPYVMLSVMPKVRSLDPNLADAAMDLGATPWQALYKVIVPQIMPGIVSGAIIAFTMSFDDFIISYFSTGRGIKNLSIMVYTMSKRVNPSINAISTLIVLFIAIGLTFANVVPLIRERRRKKKPSLEQEVTKKNGPKWAAGIAVAAVVCLCLTYFGMNMNGGAKPYAGQTLHLYLPGEYMGENFIPQFEEQTGAKVIVDNFDSNEQAYIKIANGDSYDVVIPSDYMIERLIQEERLQKLAPGTAEAATVQYVDDVLNQPYDPLNEYSVPYFWGSVGIVYDKSKVSEEELEKEGWNIFLDPKFKGDIYLYDSERDSFMQALKALNLSMNTDNEAEIQKAYEWLLEVVNTMKPEIVTDEVIDNMAQARKALALVYSGDAAYIISENPDIGFFLPAEGTNIWTDGMAIPANANNPELANEFIKYAAGYEAQYDNSTFVGYTSPNAEVMEELTAEGGDFEGNEAYVPRKNYPQDEVFQYNEKTRKLLADLWSRVKIAASNAS